MTFEDMQNFLNGIQAEKPQTKIMNAILSCYQEVKILEKMVIELQEKVNEIIGNWNEEIEGVQDAEIRDAAPVQQEEDAISNDIAAATETQQEEIL